MKLSVVVPCFNEEAVIEPFYRSVVAALVEKSTPPVFSDIEYIFVDDGSTDYTLEKLKKLAHEDSSVRYLSFSRNFGKEAALYAGLQYAQGDYVITMDADGQHPPAMIPQMVDAILSSSNEEQPYDMVRLRRAGRDGEPVVRSWLSEKFYKVIDSMSDTVIVNGSCDFQLMSRKVVDAILSLKEYNRFYKGISSWVGFKVKWLDYKVEDRIGGDTKWNLGSLFLYAINGIIAFSTAPLVIASIVGLVCFVIALIAICFIVIRTIIFGDPVAGWPTMTCVVLLLGSIQLLCIGILGQYLSKLYLEAKRRPIYLIATDNLLRR